MMDIRKWFCRRRAAPFFGGAVVRKIMFMVIFTAGLIFGKGVEAEAAEGDMFVTVDAAISLSLDTSDPSNKVLYGEGKIYGVTENAASHEFVSVTLPDELVMDTPKGEKPAPPGTAVEYTGSINARKGYVNHQAENGMDGLTVDDISAGKIAVTIPFSMVFKQYGAGEYSISIPVTLTMAKAYGSYSSALDFTPWDELVASGGVTVSDGKVTKITKKDAILEVDPRITELASNLFTYATYTELVLPPSVTAAGKACYNSKIEKVVFEEGYTEIPAQVCYYATKLETAIVPDEVTTIGTSAFENCTRLTDFEFPSALASLGSYSFRKCTKLGEFTVYRNLPKSSSLGSASAFYQAGLKKITFVEGVTEIPSYFCYEGCAYLTELNLPTTLEKIGVDAFTNAKTLEELVIRSDVENASSSYSPFKGSEIKRLVFEDGVTTIASSLFRDGCSSLTSLYIPSSVTAIGGYAFRNAASLKELTMRNNISLSGVASPFEGSGIEDLHISEGVSTIPAHLFDGGCSHIRELDFPAGMTFVGPDAFRGAVSLDRVVVRSDMTVNTGVVVSPFRDGDIKEVEIAEGVTTIPRYFFSDGVSSLTSIGIPATLSKIDTHAFYGCRSLESLDIPANITYIGAAAFGGAEALKSVRVNSDIATTDASGDVSPFSGAGIESVIISEGVTELPRCMFAGGVLRLTSLSIPSTLETINAKCFQGCSSLEALDIPTNVTHIGYCAFEDAASLKTVIVRSDISVDAGSATTVFSGAGIEKIVVSDGVTEIPYAFFKGGVAALTDLQLPETLTTIGVGAFSGCTSLAELDIPASVTELGINSFENATSLKSLRMKNIWRMSSLYSAFAGSGIETLVLDDGLPKVIGHLLADGCTHLTDVYLPASVTLIDYGAFRGGGDITVHFAGTTAQWENVIVRDWTPYQVICSDTPLMGMMASNGAANMDGMLAGLAGEDTETEPESAEGQSKTVSEDEQAADGSPVQRAGTGDGQEEDVTESEDGSTDGATEGEDGAGVDGPPDAVTPSTVPVQGDTTGAQDEDDSGEPDDGIPKPDDAITEKRQDEDGDEDEGG